MNIVKKIVSGVMALTMMVGVLSDTVYATDVVNRPATECESVYNQVAQSNSLKGWAQGPQIYSEAGIVMDMDSGAILYAKNIDDKHYPASITKVMTALVALEHYKMDETVTFTWDDIGFLEYGDAHIGMKPDEQVSMRDCMYGMMLASANEVSHAIGAHMEGGFEQFLKVMNEKSKELGCTNSNWMNTNGLHDSEHYTSARDMAYISAAAFEYNTFREIVKTKQHTIPTTNITAETRTFQQNHKMIWSANSNYYEYCVGGKTGYTDQALTTLVTFATKEDTNLVAVVLRTHGGGKNAYVDTRAMLDYAFDHFTKVPITSTELVDSNIESVSDHAYVMLPTNLKLEDLEWSMELPEELADKTGVVSYTYKGQAVGNVEVTITQACYNEIHGIKEVKQEETEVKTKLSLGVKLILLAMVCVVFAMIALIVLVAYKRKQVEKRRRLRRKREREQYRERLK